MKKEYVYDDLSVEQAQRLVSLGFTFLCEDGHATACYYSENVKAD